jgi:hypothetical protein
MYSLNNGGKWQRITRQIPDNVYDWLIPDLPRQTDGALVKVAVYNQNGGLIGEDVLNNPFAIRLVELTAPLAGDTLASGGTMVISWNSFTTTDVANVMLQYRKGPGKPWVDIATVAGNPGVYTWTPIPDINNPKTAAQIRVILLDANGNRIDAAKVGDLNYNPPPI